jgi:hypothetical protein
VPAEIECVNVEVLAESPRHPVPVAGVIQAAVHQDEGRFPILSPIPELELEAVGVEKVGDGFHVVLPNSAQSAGIRQLPSERET